MSNYPQGWQQPNNQPQYQQPYQGQPQQYQQPYQQQPYQQYQPYYQPQAQNVVVNVGMGAANGGESYFDGTLAQQVGYTILGALVTVFTLGICFPWALCILYGWETKHTVINGHRLRFDGTAMQLFGKWVLWLFLTVITFGIYSFWLRIALKKWIVKHTFMDYR